MVALRCIAFCDTALAYCQKRLCRYLGHSDVSVDCGWWSVHRVLSTTDPDYFLSPPLGGAAG